MPGLATPGVNTGPVSNANFNSVTAWSPQTEAFFVIGLGVAAFALLFAWHGIGVTLDARAGRG